MADDFGEATIVYDHPEEGTVEETVPNEHVVLVQDHWTLKVGEDDDRDLVRRIPRERVHYVERSVAEFEREVATFTEQVESVADDIRARLLGGRGGGEDDIGEVRRIDVESGEARDEDDEHSG